MTQSPIRSERAKREFAIEYALWLKENYPQEYAARLRMVECRDQAEEMWEKRNELVERKDGDERVQPTIEWMADAAEALEAEASMIYNDPANWQSQNVATAL